MISTFLVGLALRQDGVQFKFQPKVGEKYRYSMTSEDEKGKPTFPANIKVFMVYKIAGVKDGKYTVHQNLEFILPGGKSSSELYCTMKIDSQMVCETVFSAEAEQGEMAVRSFNHCLKLYGTIGVLFPGKPMKAGETWSPTLDIPSLAKAAFPPVPGEVIPIFDGKVDLGFTLDKFEPSQATFTTKLRSVMNLSADENGLMHKAMLTTDCDQTSSLDPATGMLIKADRKVKIEMTGDGEKLSASFEKVHLELVK